TNRKQYDRRVCEKQNRKERKTASGQHDGLQRGDVATTNRASLAPLRTGLACDDVAAGRLAQSRGRSRQITHKTTDRRSAAICFLRPAAFSSSFLICAT